MDNEQLEYKINQICDDCESLMRYGRSANCDHIDYHVISLTLSASPCDYCHNMYHAWEEAEDLRVDASYILELMSHMLEHGTEDPPQPS